VGMKWRGDGSCDLFVNVETGGLLIPALPLPYKIFL